MKPVPVPLRCRADESGGGLSRAQASAGGREQLTVFHKSCAFFTLASAPARSKGGTSEGAEDDAGAVDCMGKERASVVGD